MFRRRGFEIQVLLAHPGGPLFNRKDDGVWTVPKGEVNPGEDLLQTAMREFEEEIGSAVAGDFIPLGTIRQKSGKIVHAWAVEGDLDCSKLVSNTFTMEWPPRSGKTGEFPEVDRAEFFTIDSAKVKINPAQVLLIDRLSAALIDPKFDQKGGIKKPEL